MSSEYAQKGKAGSLAANERTSTPNVAKPAAKPAPRLARGSRGPGVPVASQRHPSSSPQGTGLYVAATGKPYVPGKPMGVDKAIGLAVGVKPSAVAKAVEHPLRFAAQNRKAFESSGYKSAPITPTGLIQATSLSQIGRHEETAGLARASSLFGGKRKVQAETAKAVDLGSAAKAVSKLPKAQQKAIQVVREGTPLADRISAASDQKEIAALKAAQKFVHDVNGMPRIKPEHHGLIDVYEKALAEPPQDALRGALKGARSVRGKQEAGYSVERSARFAAASKYLNDSTLSPAERIGLAKNELKGELPKIDFQGMKVLDEPALAKLQAHILDHPHLMSGQKIRAAEALSNALAGKVPTNSELTLLEHVFGKTTADSLGQIHNHPFKDALLGALNVPRSLMASFDLSAPFRQGLVVSIRHPTIFAKNFGPMVKAFGSEKFYHAMIDEIHARPTYPMMMEAKLRLTELGPKIGAREEQFGSDLAEKLNLRSIPGPLKGKKYATGPGDVVRASGRAYTGFLDKTRADVFDHLVQTAQAQGENVQGEKFLNDLGRYINSATGGGPLGGLQGAAPALNAVFFSPRLLASRLDLIFSPLTYAKTDPFVRREALKSMVAMAGTLSTLLALASQVPGVKVVLDPRNPDWGKIKVGNTRIDIGGGFQQPLRLFAQLATGTAISSTTGKKLNLTAGGFGQPNRLDLFLRFFEGKESPIASLVTDWARNSNQVGEKFDPRTALTQRLIPLLAQDSYSLYKDQHGGMNGLAAAFAGYGIGSFGFGFQTYGAKPAKAKTSSSYDPYGSSSDYAQESSTGGSVYAQSP